MNEEKEKQAAVNPGNGSGTPAAGIIERAEQAGKRLEEQNQKMEENIKRMEELQARQMLGGSTAGPAQAAAKPEMSDAEYSRLALQGKLPPKE